MDTVGLCRGYRCSAWGVRVWVQVLFMAASVPAGLALGRGGTSLLRCGMDLACTLLAAPWW